MNRKYWTNIGISLYIQDVSNGLLENNWTKVPDYQNALHNYGDTCMYVEKNHDGSYDNIKYIDNETGQYEVVVNKNTGEIIYNDTNGGTFNYYSPNSIYSSGLMHVKYDVNPYIDFGNSLYDKTSYNIRAYSSISSTIFFGKFHFWDSKDMEKSFKEYKKSW